MSDVASVPTKPGRGLVIAGGILAGISVAITVATCVYFVTGLIEGPEAMSMIFVFLLLGWLLLATPTWIAGIVLLGLGRQRQRGQVRGYLVAWIIALGGLPLVGMLLMSAASSAGSQVLFFALIASIPLAIIGSIAAGAWLVWGKPAALTQ